MFYGIFPGGVAFNPQTDIPDLDGKVILVTGGNIGLGKQTVLELAKHNPKHIYVLARNRDKSLIAIEEIKAEVPSSSIEYIHCDLSCFSSVQTAARIFASKETRLDLLFLNAGVMAIPAATTTDGYEIQFGTNHMGHALLTELLLPTLLKTAKEPQADVRVICLTSVGHAAATFKGIDFDQLKKPMPWHPSLVRYAQSKLANILFATALAKRYPSLTVVAVHPGMVNTELYRSVVAGLGLNSLMNIVKKAVFTSVDAGVKNQLWAATAKRGKGKGEVMSGVYYTPVSVTGNGSWQSQDEELAERLWVWTQEELKGFIGE